jgi:hypothetical protein
MPMTSVSIESIRADSASPNESRTTVLVMTIPVAPASPMTNRARISAAIERAKEQTTHATAKAADPWTGGRRPTRSEIGPQMSRPTASPARKSDRVSNNPSRRMKRKEEPVDSGRASVDRSSRGIMKSRGESRERIGGDGSREGAVKSGVSLERLSLPWVWDGSGWHAHIFVDMPADDRSFEG